MRTEQITVVGGAHENRIVRSAGHRAADPVERGIYLGMKAVVEIAVALTVAVVNGLDRRSRPVPGVIRLPEGDLGGRLGAQVFIGRGRRLNRRGIQV